MKILDKIRAFLKWYGEGVDLLYTRPEAKGTEKKVADAPGKKVDESSSK